MALIPSRRRDVPMNWEPFDELFPTRLTEMFRAMPALRFSDVGGFSPIADVEETDAAFVVEIELPGVEKKDITIEVAGRRLTVTGERQEPERPRVMREHHRSLGQFRYEVILPGDVNIDAVEAHLADGVLTVTAPKAVGSQARRISVA